MKRTYWIYILECANGNYYTGYTIDLKRRYAEHVAGTARCKYTRSFKPIQIAQSWIIFGEKSIALRVEDYIKRCSRAIKRDLIANPVQLITLLPELMNAGPPTAPPTQLSLAAVAENWVINYIATNSSVLTLLPKPTRELVLLGNIDHTPHIIRALSTWVRKRASSWLRTELTKLSTELQLQPRKIIIRGQSTRWGSCSSDHTISLNYKLIFLPPHLVRYVLIHELCHLQYLDHSIKFWQLVAQYDAQWLINRKLLKQANDFIPTWLE